MCQDQYDSLIILGQDPYRSGGLGRALYYHLLKRPFTSGQAISSTDFWDLFQLLQWLVPVSYHAWLLHEFFSWLWVLFRPQCHMFTIMNSSTMIPIPWHPSPRCMHVLTNEMFMPPSDLQTFSHPILWYPI